MSRARAPGSGCSARQREVFPQQVGGDQVTGDDEEDIDADESAGQPARIDVVCHDGKHGDGTQAVDVWPVGRALEHPDRRGHACRVANRRCAIMAMPSVPGHLSGWRPDAPRQVDVMRARTTLCTGFCRCTNGCLRTGDCSGGAHLPSRVRGPMHSQACRGVDVRRSSLLHRHAAAARATSVVCGDRCSYRVLNKFRPTGLIGGVILVKHTVSLSERRNPHEGNQHEPQRRCFPG